MATAMAATTKSLATSNQQMNVKQMQGLMNAYEKESMKMDMGTEMSIDQRLIYILFTFIVDETFDSIFEGDEAEESLVMDKLYDEIGIEFTSKVRYPSSYCVTHNVLFTDWKCSDEVGEYQGRNLRCRLGGTASVLSQLIA
jgi:hypothetical protein